MSYCCTPRPPPPQHEISHRTSLVAPKKQPPPTHTHPHTVEQKQGSLGTFNCLNSDMADKFPILIECTVLLFLKIG